MTIEATVIQRNKQLEATVDQNDDIIVKHYAGSIGSIPLYFLGLRDVDANSFANGEIVVYNAANTTFYGTSEINLGNVTVSGNASFHGVTTDLFNATSGTILDFTSNTAVIETATISSLAADTATFGTISSNAAVFANTTVTNTLTANIANVTDLYVDSLTANVSISVEDITSNTGSVNTLTINNGPTVFLSGPITSSNVVFDGHSNVELITSIENDTVLLGTHTVGDYVQSITIDSNSALTVTGNGESAIVELGTVDATTSGQVGVISYDPFNFNISGRTVNVSNIHGANTKIQMKNGNTVPSLDLGELFVDVDNNHLLFEVANTVYTLQETTKTLIDSLNVDADTLDGIDSSQFLRNDQDGVLNGEFTATGDINLGGQVHIGFLANTHAVAIGRTVDRFWIAPMDGIGGYQTDKELTFDAAGENIWTAEGGFKTTGDLLVSGDVKSTANTWTLSANGQLVLDGNFAFHEGYHPNADQWTVARVIGLVGDITGSASVDGSTNVDISTTVDQIDIEDRSVLGIQTPEDFAVGKLDVTYSDINGSPNLKDSVITVSSANTAGEKSWQLFSDAGNGLDDNLYFRNGTANTWNSFAKIWTDSNDGTGSGLDADLWDGSQFSDYLNQPLRTTDNVSFNQVTATVIGTVSSLSNHTTSDLLEGSNLYYTLDRANTAIDNRVTKAFVDALNVDADTLDGINSTQFLRNDQSGTLAGSLTITQDNNVQGLLNVGWAAGDVYAASMGRTINRFWIAPNDAANGFQWDKELTFDPDGDNVWTAEGGFKASGDLTVTGNTNVSGSMSVTGDLVVSGNTTFLDTQNLDVTDATITLNKGQPSPFNDIGMVMQRYETANTSNYNIAFAWKEDSDRFVFGSTTNSGNTNSIAFTEEFATITADKKFGVGVVPTHELHIKSSLPTFGLEGDNSTFTFETGTESVINTTAANGLVIQTSGTPRINLLANGYLGLNKGAPEVLLDANGDVQIGEHQRFNVQVATTTAISQVAIMTFAHATFGYAKVKVVAKDSVTGERQISELLITHDGITAYATEYGVIFTGADLLADYDVDILGSEVRLLATPASVNSTNFKIMTEIYKD